MRQLQSLFRHFQAIKVGLIYIFELIGVLYPKISKPKGANVMKVNKPSNWIRGRMTRFVDSGWLKWVCILKISLLLLLFLCYGWLHWVDGWLVDGDYINLVLAISP